jgi:Niemann-Pick C1 protein
MDLIGGGAKDYHAFLKFLGDEKALGSPFQIDFPSEASSPFTQLDLNPRNCADSDLGSKCACVDCPAVCPALPPQLTPEQMARSCQVGAITCLSFVLLIIYGLAALSFLTGFTISKLLRRKKEHFERVALAGDTSSSLNNQGAVSQPLGGSGSNGGQRSTLVGASSLALYFDGEESAAPSDPTRHHLGRGASLLDPIETVQPRQYRLNTVLRRAFYRMGHVCANYPWLTFVVIFALFGGLNYGWKYFQVETDPVRLWVAPNSQSRIQKDFFDEHFGPFYRPQQIFLTAPVTGLSLTDPITNSSGVTDDLQPILSWPRLQWWGKVEAAIASLETAEGVTLDDVCFKPAGPEGDCVIQSVLGWYRDLSDWDEETWGDRLLYCADSPGDQECLPPFGQPLSPALVLGGVDADDYLNAKSLVITYVINNSLDSDEVAKVESWERVLRAYLYDLSYTAPRETGTQVFFSTGVSLEEELNKSTNTDIRIVVLSYLVMFLYVSLTLGSNSSTTEDGSVVGALYNWIINIPRLFKSKAVTSSPIMDSRNRPTWFPRLPRSLFIGSKFFLGLFGIALVILSVAASVGLFSFLHVRVTLIIAEVIPFLVLAVGVDNVFILVHELDRQNLVHGPNAQNPAIAHNSAGLNGPMSPTSFRSPFESTHGGSDADADSMPVNLSAEERVARTVAKMGPSILLSTTTETVAFALGALVPMPAVRNFALYAAGSVFLNALLQLTVFVSAMTIDLRRVEASTFIIG